MTKVKLRKAAGIQTTFMETVILHTKEINRNIINRNNLFEIVNSYEDNNESILKNIQTLEDFYDELDKNIKIDLIFPNPFKFF